MNFPGEGSIKSYLLKRLQRKHVNAVNIDCYCSYTCYHHLQSLLNQLNTVPHFREARETCGGGGSRPIIILSRAAPSEFKT